MYMYKYIFIFESITNLKVLTCNGSWKCVFSRTLKCMNNYSRFKEKIKYSLKYIIMIICVLNFQVISQCEYNYYVYIMWLIFLQVYIYTYFLYFMNLYFWIKYIEMTMFSIIMLIFTNKSVLEMNVNEEDLKLPTVSYFYV